MIKRTDLPSDRFSVTQNMSAKERAFGGEWYKFADEPELREATDYAWKQTAKINEIAKTDRYEAMRELKKVAPHISQSADIIFPFVCDYFEQLYIGDNTFINMGFLHLSGGKVTIGNNCFIGPNCRLYTPNHCIDNLELRRQGWQYDAPISIGNDVWFGGDVIVCPGVSIGNNVVVGAGSVVTKDIPDNVVVAGNSAKIIKHI